MALFAAARVVFPRRGALLGLRGQRRALSQQHPVPALQAVVAGATARFDETVDLALRLGVDPRRADQNLDTSGST